MLECEIENKQACDSGRRSDEFRRNGIYGSGNYNDRLRLIQISNTNPPVMFWFSFHQFKKALSLRYRRIPVTFPILYRSSFTLNRETSQFETKIFLSFIE